MEKAKKRYVDMLGDKTKNGEDFGPTQRWHCFSWVSRPKPVYFVVAPLAITAYFR